MKLDFNKLSDDEKQDLEDIANEAMNNPYADGFDDDERNVGVA